MWRKGLTGVRFTSVDAPIVLLWRRKKEFCQDTKLKQGERLQQRPAIQKGVALGSNCGQLFPLRKERSPRGVQDS